MKWIRLVMVGLLAAAAMAEDTSPVQSVRVVGHRGFGARAPENTLVSLQLGIAAGADGVEFDIRRTDDGHAVLLHDAELDRTTTGTGRVDRMKLAAVDRLDAGSWKGAEFAGEKVPTLAQALTLCAEAGRTAVIEIKDPGMARVVADAVAAAPETLHAVVIAFSDRELRQLHKVRPQLAKLWLCGELPAVSVAEQAEYLVKRAAACGAIGVDLDHSLLSEALIRALHEKKLRVWCYTVNQDERMKLLYQWGVDGITSDRPDQLRQVYDQLGRTE